jgi:hypothetical protein
MMIVDTTELDHGWDACDGSRLIFGTTLVLGDDGTGNGTVTARVRSSAAAPTARSRVHRG